MPVIRVETTNSRFWRDTESFAGNTAEDHQIRFRSFAARRLKIAASLARLFAADSKVE